MITEKQRRNQILRRVNLIPKEKLKELDEYVSKLEIGVRKNSNALSFAGAWHDIDDTIFDGFTKDLINNRKKNRIRIDE
ncbi:MAG: hypothetical protein L3J41_08495 [Melioribacteraceae bacterium]|nr:hypothetical protein [Melioribacteraceae bacterium]